MLTTKHNCYTILAEMKSNGVDVDDALSEVVNGVTPKLVVNRLVENGDDVVMFYKNLNSRAHKIIKEILTCDGAPVGTYIKIATSIITQSVITAEHLYESSDVAAQSHFFTCIGVSRLSEALAEYFNTGDPEPLIQAVSVNKQDVKSILD